MDVERLRKDCKTLRMFYGPLSTLGAVSDALLRILDAFEVMERERFSISVEGRGFTCVDRDGHAFTARFESPLLTLLAASDKLKGANDADSK